MKSKILAYVFLIASLSPIRTSQDLNARTGFFVVWNVGQGQWATIAQAETCTHFDMGGEKMPAKKIKQLCGRAKNRIFISHWDWDHVSFLGKARRLIPKACVALPPSGRSSQRKMKLLEAYKNCPPQDNSSTQVTTLFRTKPETLGSNERSSVVMAEDKILIPGDSPSSQEKVWDDSIEMLRVRWLLLGHHGSRTSTSEELLDRVPNLKIAIASARFKKYGHPHVEVTERLRRHHIPILRTEDWGNIWFELPSPEPNRKTVGRARL